MAYSPYTETEFRERIRTLEDGLVQVARGVNFSDRGVTYNSAEEIRGRIRYFQDLLAQAIGGRSRQSIGVSCKGF